VVVGGRGAPHFDPPPGVTPIAELEDFHGWLRRLGARG